MAISFSGFDNPFDTVAKVGKEFRDTEDAYRKALAYNALKQQYGDKVGNLDWGQAQNAFASEQKLPGEIAQQGATLASTNANTAATQQNTDYNALANPLRLRSAQQTLDQNAAMNPLTVEAAKLGNRQSQQNLDKGAAALGDDAAERKRNTLLGLTAAVKERMAAGMPPEQAFDSIAQQAAAMEGTDPAELAAVRQQFLKDPQGTLTAIETHLNNTHPNTALLRAQADQTRAQAAKDRAAATAAKSNPNVTEAGVQAILEQGEHIDNTLGRLLGDGKNPGTVDQVSHNSIVRGTAAMMDKAAGFTLSPTSTAYIKDLQSLTASLGLDALTRLKAQGVTLGQVTEAEHALLQQSVTALQSTRDPSEIKRELQRIQQHYKKYQAALLDDVRKRPGGMEALNKVMSSGASASPGGKSSATSGEAGDAFLKKYGIK